MSLSKPVLISGVYYNSTRIAAMAMNVDKDTIKNRINSSNFNEYSYTEYIPSISKVCYICKERKALNEFKSQRRSRDGRSTWCKKCWSIYVIKNTNPQNKKINMAKYHKTEEGRSYLKLRKTQRRELIKRSLNTISEEGRQYIRWLHWKVRSMRRDGFDVHLDHIIPVSKGGLHIPDNLQIIPAEDNQRKTDKMDWNQNGDIRDNKFNDQYHFEL